ncbi:hypothetical protein AM588_10010917 [Phytophthora nicotianae]|uniref:ubiquitinyl hydrolase 1 n=1 Tax=Phytophthora nicotianae TaxID=4792 RepID=A0A0W8DTD5_PHYNI|nr:hypothetical protein AM588_10010917 [Phytophthora nicotianae]
MTEKELYHERQTLYRCGLHALNNVLRGPVFSKASLDEACMELATLADPKAGNGLMNWAWNPHRAPLGLGNYDVNALTLALQQKGKILADCVINVAVVRIISQYFSRLRDAVAGQATTRGREAGEARRGGGSFVQRGDDHDAQ